MNDLPERIILECRIKPIELANGDLWPWTIRKRALFKALLRQWGLEIVSHEEKFASVDEAKKEAS